MGDIKIIVPSRGRAKTVLTDVQGMILCVDEREVFDYRKYNDCEIITHNGLKSLSLIRQFIYSKYGDVFMIDDDIVSVTALYKMKDVKLPPESIVNIINETYERAKSINAPLWGFNNDPSPTHYNQHRPFYLKGYINGCAFGMLKNENLYFHEKTVACESHWINLLNAHHNRICFIDKRFHFTQKANSTFTLKGGQVGKRTLDSEREDTLLLKRYFGDSIRLKRDRNKLFHQYQREMSIKL